MADEKPQHWWQTVPGCLTAFAAIITAFTGLMIALNQMKPDPKPSPTPTPDSPPAASPIHRASPVPKEEAISTPKSPTGLTAAPAVPSNTCPVYQGMFWLQYPNVWYGPSAYGDSIQFSNVGGFFVYFGAYNNVVPYPDPYNQIQRNVWFPLQNSHFWVCVDSAGQVLALSQ